MEVNQAIIDKIRIAIVGTEFSAIPIVETDLQQALKSYCIKAGIIKSNINKVNSQCIEKVLSIVIYFLGQNEPNYKLDNLKMQGLLEAAFLEGIYIKDDYIPIQSIESKTVDSILSINFDLYLLDLLPDMDQSETIEEIQYKGVIK